MSDETEQGGLLGLIARIRAGANAPLSTSGISPELAAQGISANSPLIRPDGSPTHYETGKPVNPVADPSAPASGVGMGDVRSVDDPRLAPDQVGASGLRPGDPDVISGTSTVEGEKVAPRGSQGASRASVQPADVSIDAPVSVADSAAAPAADASPYSNPVVAAYMADRARRQSELAAAQKQALPLQNLAVGMAATRNAAMRTGTNPMGPDTATFNAQMEEANRPLTDLAAKNKAGEDALAESGKLQDFTAKADAADPRSPENVAFRDFYKQRYGMTLGAHMTLAKGGPLAENYQNHVDKERSDQRHLTTEREIRRSTESEGDKNRKNQILLEQMRLQGERDKAGGKEKDVPARTVTMLQGADEEQQAANKIRALAPDTGFIAALTPGNTKNQEYNAAKAAYGQARGKAIHGGPSGDAAKAFEATVPSPYFSTQKSIENTADRITGEAHEDRARQNALLQSQGISNPLPPVEASSRGAQQKHDAQGRLRQKGSDGLWHLVK